METDSVSRFWDKYIEETRNYGVSNDSARWYVSYVETYIKANPTIRLAKHSEVMLENYLRDLGRKRRLTDWRFTQIIEALQILFVKIISPTWADGFPWEFWIAAAKQLPTSHATVAREHSQSNDYSVVNTKYAEKGLLESAKLFFPDYFEKLIVKIRTKHYSIRTEQAYLARIARYLSFHSMADPKSLPLGVYYTDAV